MSRAARDPAPNREGAVPELAIGIPAYYYPGTFWDCTLTATPTVRYVVVNPGDGPGVRIDPAYSSTIEAARASGVRLLGYVPTTWGSRPPREVLRDVKTFRDWYGVTDVFLDEAATSSTLLPYYADLVEGIRSGMDGPLVALNPGTTPDEGYVSLCDVLVQFEGTRAAYARWSPPAWQRDYPRQRFWHVVYGTSRRSMTAVLRRAARSGAGVVYATDRVLENPWNGLPPYWDAELRAVTGINEELEGRVQRRPGAVRPRGRLSR